MQRMLYFSQAAFRVNFFLFMVFLYLFLMLIYFGLDRTEFCGKTIFFVKSFCIFISGMIKCHVMVEYLLIRYLGTCHHKTSGTPGTQDLSNIQCQHESMLRSIQSETFCQNSGFETRNKSKEIKLL